MTDEERKKYDEDVLFRQKCGNYVTTLLTHDCSTHEPCPTCAALREQLRLTIIADKRRLSDTVAAQVAEMAALRAIVARVEDVEGIRVYIKSVRRLHYWCNERCPGDIDDPFISYQEAKISKGKLCEIIAKSIRTWLKEG